MHVLLHFLLTKLKSLLQRLPSKDDKTVSMKSVINILGLGLECNDSVTIAANGADEQEAIQSLKRIISVFCSTTKLNLI